MNLDSLKILKSLIITIDRFMRVLLFLFIVINSTQAQRRGDRQYHIERINCESFAEANDEVDLIKWVEDYEGSNGYRIKCYGHLNVKGYSKDCVRRFLGAPNESHNNRDIYIISSGKTKKSSSYCSITLYYNEEFVVYDVTSAIE